MCIINSEVSLEAFDVDTVSESDRFRVFEKAKSDPADISSYFPKALRQSHGNYVLKLNFDIVLLTV